MTDTFLAPVSGDGPASEPPCVDAETVLAVVAEASARAAAATEHEARLGALVDGLRALGFGRVLLELRDAALERRGLLARGPLADAELQRALVPAPVWRRWLRLLERRRASVGLGTGWWLDLRDVWARDEFGGALGAPVPAALYLVPVAGADGRPAATLLLEGAQAEPPAPATVQGVALLVRELSQELARAGIAAIAEQRAERLQRLHEAGAALARSLDVQEIVRELARQVQRLVPHDGIVVAHPDLEQGVVRTALRLVHGLARPRAEQPLGAGPIAEVARTGGTVRVDDYDAGRSELAAADDVVGDAGPAGSVLAVPMRVGTQLVGVLAVHAAVPRAFAPEDEELLRTIAAQAGTALANARLYAESEAERRQSEALVAVARAVGESLRLGEVLRLVLRHSMALLRAEGACIALRRDAWLHVVAGVGAVELLSGVHLPMESLIGQAMRDGEPLVRNDVRRAGVAYEPLTAYAEIERAIIVPLGTAQDAIGAIAVVNRGTDFGRADARVLQRLAEHVAVAIVNARLFEEVEASTREWKVAFDAIAAGMVVLDDEGRVSRCNARAAELLGVESGALLGRAFVPALTGEAEPAWSPVREATDLAPAADGAAARLVRRALQHGRLARGLTRAAAPNDDRRGRMFDLVAAPHPDGGAVVTFDDVTAQLALAERHRLVVETTRDAIVITDRDGVLRFANPAAHALFGRGDDLLGLRAEALVQADEAAIVTTRRRLAHAGEPQRYEVVVPRPDGESRIVAVSTAPLRELGEVTGNVASLRDVTEERRAQAATRASEARYSRLVESASDAILTIAPDGTITSANRALEMGTGLTRDQLVGQHCSLIADPRERDALTTLLDTALRGERERRELRYRDRRGRERVASVTTAPIVEGDTVVSVLAVVRDVTEERRMADQLLQREKLAAMGQLVSGVAHELNNPLAGVLAFSELLLAEPALDAEGGAEARELRELADTIHREARRAARIVGKLLSFARQHPPQRQATDLNRVALEALDLRRYALRAHQVDIALELDYELPATWADGHQLQQVVLNLITNAEHALLRQDGERRLVLGTHRDGDRLALRVSDTGPGLSPEARDRIFEPFYTTKPVGEGTGLGLAVSQGIVREHGARLLVESEPGRGATFVVELPWIAPPAEAAIGA